MSLVAPGKDHVIALKGRVIEDFVFSSLFPLQRRERNKTAVQNSFCLFGNIIILCILLNKENKVIQRTIIILQAINFFFW